jgi:hypothetical protein
MRLDARASLQKAGNGVAVLSELEQQPADVLPRLDDEREEGVGRELCHHDETLAELDEPHAKLPAARRLAKSVARCHDSGDERGDALRVQTVVRLDIDGQSVATQHDRGLDALAACEGLHDIAN